MAARKRARATNKTMATSASSGSEYICKRSSCAISHTTSTGLCDLNHEWRALNAKRLVKILSVATRPGLLFRKVRVGFHFVDLKDVPVRMARDQKNPLIPVHCPESRMVEKVIAQRILRVVHVGDSLVAALFEVIH